MLLINAKEKPNHCFTESALVSYLQLEAYFC